MRALEPRKENYEDTALIEGMWKNDDSDLLIVISLSDQLLMPALNSQVDALT